VDIVNDHERPWATKGDIDRVLNAVRETRAEVATLRRSVRLRSACSSTSSVMATAEPQPHVDPVRSRPSRPSRTGHHREPGEIVLKV